VSFDFKTLGEEGGEQFDADLTHAEASKRIEEFKSEPLLHRKPRVLSYSAGCGNLREFN
jgi:hypothetical protein